MWHLYFNLEKDWINNKINAYLHMIFNDLAKRCLEGPPRSRYIFLAMTIIRKKTSV